MSQPEAFEVWFRRRRFKPFLALLVTLAAAAVFHALSTSPRLSERLSDRMTFAAIICAVLAAIAFWYWFTAVMLRGRTLHGTPEGLTLLAGRHRVGPIPWRAISRFAATKGESGVIGISLRYPEMLERWEGKLGPYRGGIVGTGAFHLVLPPRLINTSLKRAVWELEEMRQLYS